jgi:hypothetical protein
VAFLPFFRRGVFFHLDHISPTHYPSSIFHRPVVPVSNPPPSRSRSLDLHGLSRPLPPHPLHTHFTIPLPALLPC